MKNFLALISALIISASCFAQDHHLVDISFSPPEKAMIKQFTGSSAMPIQANNVNGESVAIPSGKNKYQLLWFSERNAVDSKFHALLNELNNNDAFTLDIFLNDLKADISTDQNFADKSVVPNSKMLSEAVFGSELKHNRAFLLDSGGIIVKVFIARELVAQSDMQAYIMSFIPS